MVRGAKDGGEDTSALEDSQQQQQQPQQQPRTTKRGGGSTSKMKAELALAQTRKQISSVSATGAVIFSDGTVRPQKHNASSLDPAAKAKAKQLEAVRKEVQKEAMEMGLTLGYLRQLPDDYLDEPKTGGDSGRDRDNDADGSVSTSSRGLNAAAAAADAAAAAADALEPTWDKPATRRAGGRFRPPSEDPWDFKTCRRVLGRQSDQHITFGTANGVAKRFELRQGRKGVNTFILARKPLTHETESGGLPRDDWCHVAELSANTGVPRRKLMQDLQAFEAKSGPDRRLQFSELKSLLRKYGIKGDKAMRRTFDLFNTDGDSSISFDEYVAGVQILEEAMRQVDLALTFEVFDADANGELHSYEFTNIIREHCRNDPKITNQTRDRLLQSGNQIFAEGGWGATSAVSFHEFARIACKSQGFIQLLKDVGLYRESRAKRSLRSMRKTFAVTSFKNIPSLRENTEGRDGGGSVTAAAAAASSSSLRMKTKRHASMEDSMRGGGSSSPRPSRSSPTPTAGAACSPKMTSTAAARALRQTRGGGGAADLDPALQHKGGYHTSARKKPGAASVTFTR